MPSGGGDLRRLTYLGSFSVPCGWLDDGTVLFRSPGFEAHRVPTICRVGVAGGLPQSLRLGPAANLALSMSGRVVLERNDLRADPAHWKRYRGGRTGKLWIAHDIEGEFTPLIRLNGNLTRPLWVGTRVYFVSDHEGVGNLFSCTAEGEDLRSETRHTDFYARTRRPTADPSSITQAAIFMPSMWKHGNRESSPSNTTRNALSVNGVSFCREISGLGGTRSQRRALRIQRARPNPSDAAFRWTRGRSRRARMPVSTCEIPRRWSPRDRRRGQGQRR